MPINILVINSLTDKNSLLTAVFKELEQKKVFFKLWSSKAALINQFKQNHWSAKKIFLGPDLKNRPNLLLFCASLLFIQLKFLISLIGLKIKNQADFIICLNFNEKIIITGPAKLLGIKVFWLESPDLNYRQINKFIFRLYKINHRFAEIIAFNNYAKLQLAGLGCDENKIKTIPPGAKLSQYQENIFNKLASLSQANFHRKYFTVGVIAALDQKQKIEAIFQAIKNCLPVIPNIQLIIIGEGQERKSLSWLAKKMAIENLVWLVGEQEQLKKWLHSFDIFLATGDSLKLDDYGNILEAMASGLPILAPRNIGLEDLILENKTGSLIESNNSELLARQIIKLHQDKKLRAYLGKNGRERANQFFTLEKMVAGLEQTFKIK
ncbi:MAG: glycosyltransferase family 4 protein [bacterium]|nr:glycosyltransferase family 4 protein [bacterium]